MAGRRDAYNEVYKALEDTGLPWEKVPGKKHVKLYLSGHLVGVLPHGTPDTSTAGRRRTQNFVSRVRRAAEEIRAGTFTNSRYHQ